MFSSTGTKVNNDNPAKINDLGDALTTSDYVDTVLDIISVFANRFITVRVSNLKGLSKRHAFRPTFAILSALSP